MANPEHLAILKQGVEVWNAWRQENRHIGPDLRGANLDGVVLREVDLRRANLTGANLCKAILCWAILTQADLSGADLSEADLRRADLSWAILTNGILRGADLSGANLSWAMLTQADLRGADLSRASLIETILARADLTGAPIYGISAWGVQLNGSIQKDLIITKWNEATITVDNLEIAQFIYLLLNNEKVRDVIDTMGRKAVLILGCFTKRRKTVLDAIRGQLRALGYLPIVFDFQPTASRDIAATMEILAHLSRFIIADLTTPRSVPHELATIVPLMRQVPILPIIVESEWAYGRFSDFEAYPWVMETHRYATVESLLSSLETSLIGAAEAKASELIAQWRERQWPGTSLDRGCASRSQMR